MNTDFFRQQYKALIDRRVFGENFISPDYEGFNLKNILPQIGAVFGVGELKCSTLPSDCLAEMAGVKKVILLIFDGLGYNRLLQHLNGHDGILAELAEKGNLKPLTTVFPSTTSTALASVFTGLSPAQHQIIGYHMYSKKYGLIYNTLDMKPIFGYSSRVELARDYSHKLKPLTCILEQNGIRIQVITKASIVGSGLSQITHRDLKPVPYLSESDMWTQSIEALASPGPSVSIVYYSGVDTLAHKYGAYSKEVAFELTSIDHNLEDFINGLRQEDKREIMLVLVADHGIAEAHSSVYLKDYPNLMEHLILPPVGDGRASYIFCKQQHQETFSELFQKDIAGFSLISSDELIQKGIFGQPLNGDELKEKVGDFAALSNSDRLLDYPFFEEDRADPQLGAHGGMTAEEMIVPLLSIRLSEL